MRNSVPGHYRKTSINWHTCERESARTVRGGVVRNSPNEPLDVDRSAYLYGLECDERARGVHTQ
jgi:hypothetical protein